MHVLINIPEEQYEKIQNISNFISADANQLIRDGIPLPKGHGALKDTDAICKDIISALGIHDENYLLEAEYAVYKRIKNAPTIIEADKEHKDETS